MGRGSIDRIASGAALLALCVWLGGLVALGAITAPIVFAVTPFPQSADAMTLVFRRFDQVAMACAAIVLASEAVRAAMGQRARGMARLDVARAGASALASAAAVYEAMALSPRIAALHAAGAIRGVGALGTELARLHDTAETCGKTQVVLLALVVVLHATSHGRHGRGSGSPVDAGSAQP
jgi:uncharacterized membrane protein